MKRILVLVAVFLFGVYAGYKCLIIREQTLLATTPPWVQEVKQKLEGATGQKIKVNYDPQKGSAIFSGTALTPEVMHREMAGADFCEPKARITPTPTLTPVPIQPPLPEPSFDWSEPRLVDAKLVNGKMEGSAIFYGKMELTYRQTSNFQHLMYAPNDPYANLIPDKIWKDIYCARDDKIVLEKRIYGKVTKPSIIPEKIDWEK